VADFYDDFVCDSSYSAPLYIDMKKRVLVQDSEEPDPETGELNWVEEHEDDEGTGEEEKIYIGKVRCGRFFSPSRERH